MEVNAGNVSGAFGDEGSAGLGDHACTIMIKVSYDGTGFCGFAKQPGQPTVQAQLEEALRLIFKRDIPTVCAGRTDSGVHAIGQMVSFEIEREEYEAKGRRAFIRSMNALTSDDIAIIDADMKPVGFSARFDAKWRQYKYFICTDETPPVMLRRYSWHVPSGLDVESMRVGSECLIGEHDFKSFCLAASAEGKPTCRNVMSIEFNTESLFGEDMLVITVKGNAFLHSMVRTIVGTLVLVGKGKRPPDWVKEVLEAKERRAAGENAPAQGLVFWEVGY